MISIRPISPMGPDVMELIRSLDEYQSGLYPSESNHFDPPEVLAKENAFFVGAFSDETLVGCGAVKIMPGGYGEIKRMYVSPKARGQGVAGQIMMALEEHLADSGVFVARLETGIHSTEALGLYSKFGYRETGPFGEYGPDPLSVFMEKELESGQE